MFRFLLHLILQLVKEQLNLYIWCQHLRFLRTFDAWNWTFWELFVTPWTVKITTYWLGITQGHQRKVLWSFCGLGKSFVKEFSSYHIRIFSSFHLQVDVYEISPASGFCVEFHLLVVWFCCLFIIWEVW